MLGLGLAGCYDTGPITLFIRYDTSYGVQCRYAITLTLSEVCQSIGERERERKKEIVELTL